MNPTAIPSGEETKNSADNSGGKKRQRPSKSTVTISFLKKVIVSGSFGTIKITLARIVIVGFVVLLAVCIVCVIFWPRLAPLLNRPRFFSPVTSDASKFGFESESHGWMNRREGDSYGVIECGRTDKSPKEGQYPLGRYALELKLHLSRKDSTKTNGEAYVELNHPQDLSSKTISAWVFLPKADPKDLTGDLVGDPHAPNGLQIMVRDSSTTRTEYGAWENITYAMLGKWNGITLTPSTTPPVDGYMKPGFDPTKIIEVGVKIGINVKLDKPDYEYKGSIYIDAIDWR
jgi:hypothetical protein